jgi:hypothetical protein
LILRPFAPAIIGTELLFAMKVYTLNGVPYTFDPVRAVLVKAARRRQVSPGQLELFGGPNEGDTKVENGVTYRLNANSRWERADEPDKPRAIVPVIEEDTMETVQAEKKEKATTYGIKRGVPKDRVFVSLADALNEAINQSLYYSKKNQEPVYAELKVVDSKGEPVQAFYGTFRIEADTSMLSGALKFWAISGRKKYPLLGLKQEVDTVPVVVIDRDSHDEVKYTKYGERELMWRDLNDIRGLWEAVNNADPSSAFTRADMV